MADPKPYVVLLSMYLSTVFLLPYPSCNARSSLPPVCHKFSSIYQLGDSISDTGNLIRESPTGAAFTRLPYGESFFKHPTGRCSNGLLMIDFVAKAIGVPLLNPYLNKDAIFTYGVNFAVAGATALPTESLAAKSIVNRVTNSSLSVQLDWMWSHFNSICYDDEDCAKKLKNSLFIVGEIGSNDYYYALSQGKTIEDVNSMVVDVVQAIVDGVKRVVQSGASKVLVPGTFPLGHFPAYLAAYQANKSALYKKQRSLISLSLSHNNELQKAVQELRKAHQNITIVYADYFNAFNWLFQNAARLGFNASPDSRKACCGLGGRYNFDPTRMCGAQGVPVCANPDGYIIWDGLSLTQRAYRILARRLVQSTVFCLRDPE